MPINKKEWGKQSGDSEERVFLEGPHSRFKELKQLLRIVLECIRGFRTLHFVGPCVTIFGSARFHETHPYYAITREVGAKISQLGFTVMTGGGPGLMEAANRGAKDVGGRSVGCNIILSHEQEPNKYLDRWIEFKFFFVRKLMLAKYSYAFIAMPGGFGTLDEFFEIATLVQTGKIKDFPLILMGKEYWAPLFVLFQDMIKSGALHDNDIKRIMITDSIEEVTNYIKENTFEQFGLTYGQSQMNTLRKSK